MKAEGYPAPYAVLAQAAATLSAVSHGEGDVITHFCATEEEWQGMPGDETKGGRMKLIRIRDVDLRLIRPA